MRHRVGDCRRRGTQRGFASADGGQLGAVDQLDFYGRCLAEFQDGVILPGEVCDAARTKLHLFLERPAGRLNCATLDLIDHAVWVDNEPDVDSEDQPLDAHIMADLYLGHCSAISAQVLVPRESDTVATAFGGFPAVPFGAPRSCFYDGATTRILKVPQAESNRVNPCRLSEFVHARFDRNHVGVRTQRTP